MLSLLTQCIGNGSIGIYFPKFTGTIYEILSAPIAMTEIIIGYVGAAATKGLIIGAIILATASLFVDISIAHPVMMLVFLVLTAITFRSEEHTSELQSLMRISYAVFCLKKKT